MKVSIEGQDHFLTLLFSGLYILCLYEAQISGERLQDHWSSGFFNRIILLLAGNEDIHKSLKWMSSNFGQIPPLTTELAVLERLKISRSQRFLC